MSQQSQNQPCRPGVFIPGVASYKECPIYTRTRSVVIPRGVCGSVEWTFLDSNGAILDLGLCDNESASLSVSESGQAFEAATALARFQGCGCTSVVETAATIDTNTNTVLFELPGEVTSRSGIYAMDVALLRPNGAPYLIQRGLVSVEPSLWGDPAQKNSLPSLGSLSRRLQDSREQNLLGEIEFHPDDILGALTSCVRYWNEMPPPIAYFTCQNFPFVEHWEIGTIGELLRSAANHYMRSHISVNHGGLAGNFKDRHRDYLSVSGMYLDQWRAFVSSKKMEINVASAYGTASSPYGYYYGGY